LPFAESFYSWCLWNPTQIETEGKEHAFRVTASRKVWRLAAGSTKEAKDWIRALRLRTSHERTAALMRVAELAVRDSSILANSHPTVPQLKDYPL
jgi:hypothetical protein